MAFNEPGVPTPQVDSLDLKILQLLKADAQTSFVELGKRVGLSAPAVHARVKKLQKEGVIKKHTIEVDPQKLGLVVTAFVRIQTGANRCKDLAKELEKIPEVLECFTVAGEDDLLVKLRTSTPKQVLEIMDLLKQKGLVGRSQTHLVMESHFER